MNWTSPSRAALAALLLVVEPLLAQEITASPGTYELVEGTSMQFDGRPTEKSGAIQGYRWSIVSGEGGKLSGADKARVTFHAPAIKEKTRLFTLQLDLQYASGKPSSAQINVRVHRKGKTEVVHKSSPFLSASIGFGFGYLWGGWWGFPPLIVIPCPPPGIVLPPEALLPIAVPLPEDPGYGDWLGANPDWADLLTAEALLPETVLPEAGGAGETIPPPEAAVQPEPEPAPPEPAVQPEPPPEPVAQPEPAPQPLPEPVIEAPQPMIQPAEPIIAPAPMPAEPPVIEAAPMPMDEPPMIEMPMEMPMDIPMDIPMDAGGLE